MIFPNVLLRNSCSLPTSIVHSSVFLIIIIIIERDLWSNGVPFLTTTPGKNANFTKSACHQPSFSNKEFRSQHYLLSWATGRLTKGMRNWNRLQRPSSSAPATSQILCRPIEFLKREGIPRSSEKLSRRPPQAGNFEDLDLWKSRIPSLKMHSRMVIPLKIQKIPPAAG